MTLLKNPKHRSENTIKSIRTEIVKMINTRNRGISLKDVSTAIRENSETLEKIANPNFDIANQHLPKLKDILKKLQKIHQQEKVSSY